VSEWVGDTRAHMAPHVLMIDRSRRWTRVDHQLFLDMKDRILYAEKLLLQVISFNFIVDHPYQYLLLAIKQLEGTRARVRAALMAPSQNHSSRHCTH